MVNWTNGRSSPIITADEDTLAEAAMSHGGSRILAAVEYSDVGLATAERAGRLARTLGSTLMVALVMPRSPSTYSFLPVQPEDYSSDYECAALIDLVRLLDPMGIAWRVKPVDTLSQVALLANRSHTQLVLLGAHPVGWRFALTRRRELRAATRLASQVLATVCVYVCEPPAHIPD